MTVVNGLDFDIAIIGAGPAGISAAIAIPETFSIVHFDKSSVPTRKVCGGLLTRDAVKHIGRLTGCKVLPEEVRCKQDTRILRSVDFDSKMSSTIEVGYVNVDRERLDAWLRSRIDRTNYSFMPSTKVADIKRMNGSILVTTVNGDRSRSFRVRLVLDCSGWARATCKSPDKRIAKRFSLQFSIPLNMNYQELHRANVGITGSDTVREYRAYFLKSVTDWFGWTIPKNDGLLVGIGFEKRNSFACGRGGEKNEDGFAREHEVTDADMPVTEKLIRFVKQLNESGYIAIKGIPDCDNKEEIGHFFSQHAIKGCPITAINSIKQLDFGSNGVMILGEAAGLVSPSSGDGISYALASGLAVGSMLETKKANAKSGCKLGDVDDIRIYTDLLASEIRELRFNVQKAKMLSNPKTRNAALWFLSWHNGKTMERLP